MRHFYKKFPIIIRFNADFEISRIYIRLSIICKGTERPTGWVHKDGPNFGKPDIGRYCASANL